MGLCHSKPVTADTCPAGAAAAEKIYLPGAPASLTLTPPAATNVVDAEHCVTATVHDQFGNLVPNTAVRFAVAGIVTTTGSATTGANGEAAFCYASPLLGEDSVHAYADTDNDGSQDAEDPAGDATKTWVPPPAAPSCGLSRGAGSILLDGGRATFAMRVRKKSADGAPAGALRYRYARGCRFRATEITHLIVEGNEVTIHGRGRDSHGPLVPFRVDTSDARPDTFRILWPGYAAEGPVQGGGIGINSRCSGHDRGEDDREGR